MRISFIPQRRDDTLTLEKSSGDRLRINGELFNFNPLEDGDRIEAGVIPCDWISGPVERIDGVVTITLLLPHGPNPEPWQAFPEPITVEDDGQVDIPADTAIETQEVPVEGGVNIITTIRRWHHPEEITEQFIPTIEETADVES